MSKKKWWNYENDNHSFFIKASSSTVFPKKFLANRSTRISRESPVTWPLQMHFTTSAFFTRPYVKKEKKTLSWETISQLLLNRSPTFCVWSYDVTEPVCDRISWQLFSLNLIRFSTLAFESFFFHIFRPKSLENCPWSDLAMIWLFLYCQSLLTTFWTHSAARMREK